MADTSQMQNQQSVGVMPEENLASSVTGNRNTVALASPVAVSGPINQVGGTTVANNQTVVIQSGRNVQNLNKQAVKQVVVKPVFTQAQSTPSETPDWLKTADNSVQGKIANIDEAKILSNLRAEKPGDTMLGIDPSSSVVVESRIDIIAKAEREAAEQMAKFGYDPLTGHVRGEEQATRLMMVAGYDPKTGRRLHEDAPKIQLRDGDVPVSKLIAMKEQKPEVQIKLEQNKEKQQILAIETHEQLHEEKAAATPEEKAQVEENKAKKTSLLGSVKSIFNLGSKAKSTVDKIDQHNEAKEVGKKADTKITSDERQKYIEAEKIYQEGLASIKDLIAPASMDVQYDKIRIDGIYAQSFYVYAYPRYLDVNWLAPVINFDVTMDISQFIYPISSADIMKTLKKKVAQMQSSMTINAEKGHVRDPALETALEDAEQLRTEIQRGQEKFFQFALYFTLYSDSLKKLEKIAKQLESLLGGKLVLTKRAQLQAEHGLNTCLPMCLDELYTIRNMNTSPLSTTFPFTSSDLTSDKGILYGVNRHNDSLIIFDRFALENANSVVFAKSGAGKSYAVKLEILRLMMMGTDVIVIDPENEYEALANTVGGTYLKLSLNSDRRINPFDLPKPIEGEDLQPGDLLRSGIINLHGLMKLMLGEISPEEESVLDKALIDVYALKGITMDQADPSRYEPPTMEDLYQILNSMEGANSLTQRISKFTVGSYSGIFNKPTNVDLSTGMMVFCIRDLEDALRPVAMYIVLNYIWNRVRSTLKKRVLVIDEAWSMMQHEDSAKFLFGLVKRARKYYLGVTTITQDVEDFVKSDFGKPIITNSSMQLLLKQAPSAVDMLAKIFNLTEGEKYVLLNSGVGQGLFFAGLKHVAVQVIASYTEDKIVTTNPEEVLKARDNLA